MYAPTATFCQEATKGAPVIANTGMSSSPPMPKTVPIAAAEGTPVLMTR